MFEVSTEAERAAHGASAGLPPAHSHQASASLRWYILSAICAVAIANLIFFYAHRLTNLYGDAIAHIEGARRLWDSRTPGYEEIGSVWLPVFHLLTSPLTLNDFLWRSGLAGSLVSTTAFMLTSWFMFRLGAEMNCS